MLSLGIWQINRGIYKQTLATNSQKDLSIDSALTAINQYNGIKVSGEFTCAGNKILLVDLQHCKTQIGYHALLACTHNKHQLLVNLGWLATDQLNKLTKYQSQNLKLKLTGYLVRIQHNPFIKQTKSQPNFPQIVQGVEIKFLNEILHTNLKPIMLKTTSHTGLVQNWGINKISATRHYIYAAQWFIFALIAGGMFIYINRK